MDLIVDYIIPFMIVLTVLVFVHELGHYYVARRNGVKVEVFSIGFGPEIFGWTDKNETRWRFSLIPLGGYVRMFGDADESSRPDNEAMKEMSEEDKSASLHAKSPMQRIAVSAAGPAANFLFAILLMAFLFALKGEPIQTARVGAVIPGSGADKAGIIAGDRIAAIDGQKVETFFDLSNLIKSSTSDKLSFEIERKKADEEVQKLTLSVSPVVIDKETGKPTGQRRVGIAPSGVEFVKRGALEAPILAAKKTYELCSQTLQAVGQMLVRTRSADQLGGIVAIGDMAGQSLKGGVAFLVWFMALLSVNLGLINLFPIPVLDGGHILFCTIEAIRGKPVSDKVQEYAFIAGAIIVLGLMLFTTWNDLSRYELFSWLGSGK